MEVNNMSNYKIFDIDKAEKLLPVYKKKRHYAKALLLSEIISWQYFFGNTSIVGVKISMKHHYKTKTINTVLNDLGYMLTSYKKFTIHPYTCGISETFIEFTFAPKDSETTEG